MEKEITVPAITQIPRRRGGGVIKWVGKFIGAIGYLKL